MTSPEQPYRIGIVGCGSISAVHARAIATQSGAELVSAYSRSGRNLQTFCETFSVKGYTDYDAFLNSDLDIVILCTPNGTHLDYGLPAARSGKHLVIEKPLEISVERGRQLVEACAAHGVQLAVIYQNRFIDSVISMKKQLEAGTIGKLVMARASVKWYRSQEYYRQAPWRGSLRLDGGGALINQSIHTVDLLLWMAGPVASVHAFKATLTHEGIEGEDNLVASIQFENGALGVLEASTSVTPAQNRILELHGTKGTLLLDGNRMQLLTEAVKGDTLGAVDRPAEASGGASSPLAGFSDNHHAEQYRQIIQALSQGSPPPVSGEESLASLSFVESAYLSAREGVPIHPGTLAPVTRSS